MKQIGFVMAVLAGMMLSCTGEKDQELVSDQLKTELSDQLKTLVQVIPDDKVPHSFPGHNAEYGMVDYHGWTSGFPAGSFWYMYELTGDEYWKGVAIENTVKLEKAQYLTNTHDLGFMIYCSYGNGFRITGNEDYKQVIIQASESLISRFNPVVGCIRSWDFGSWQFPVIIDNMMNLEMLFWASKVTGDPKYRDVAISHADVTLEHHFRDDMSSFHVVSYDTITGNPIEKQTHQGLDDESAWARGQAWGFYGYTVCYRETGDEKYLEAAERIGDLILENLPEDKVLYWDFDDPAIPNAERDASAAAIAASAFFELSTYSEKGDIYLEVANKMIESLSSAQYRATGGENGGFLLKHCVGHKPANREIDVALNYADYYYLEALKRQKDLKK
ncbi:MAG: glycoside hydrolase family 88 protein [Mariniphaga sp.]|nr:glycoside hydrolase family 88 protein [Mariniphaga sp.]